MMAGSSGANADNHTLPRQIAA